MWETRFCLLHATVLFSLSATTPLSVPATTNPYATVDFDAIATFFVVGVGNVSVDIRQTREPLSKLNIVRTVDGAVARFVDRDGCEVRYSEEAEGALLPIISPTTDSVRELGRSVRSSLHSQRALAVLISGHSERFYFKDSGLDRVITAANKLDVAVDCFIALQIGDVNVPFRQLRDAGLPYGFTNLSTLTNEATGYFLERGARHVNIELLNASTLDWQKQRILSEVKMVQLGDRVEQVLRDGMARYRWVANGRMLLLRHYAHQMMCGEERRNINYTSVLYVREDNSFFETPPVGQALNATQVIKPVVLTDQHCDLNQLNDKIFWASNQGAQVLFGNYTWLVYRWFRLGYVQSMMRCLELTQPAQLETQFGAMESQQSMQEALIHDFSQQKKVLPYDSLQSETFLNTLLNATNTGVLKWDLKRIDVRYFHSKLCVPFMYYPCASTKGGGYPQCPGQDCLHANCNARHPAFQAEFIRNCFKLAGSMTGTSTLDRDTRLWMQDWLKQPWHEGCKEMEEGVLCLW